jgi:hypothetical protein
MTVGAGALRARAVGACAVLALAAGCGGDDGSVAPTTSVPITTTTSPARPTTTTSLVYDPATVEGQVEQAYLRSWDVYAAAVYDLVLDEEALASVYAGNLLTVTTQEIRDRIAEGRAAFVDLSHSYQVNVLGPRSAAVVDRYQNHQVLVDPISKDPVEPDPNETIVDVFTLERTDRGWRATEQRRMP